MCATPCPWKSPETCKACNQDRRPIAPHPDLHIIACNSTHGPEDKETRQA